MQDIIYFTYKTTFLQLIKTYIYTHVCSKAYTEIHSSRKLFGQNTMYVYISCAENLYCRKQATSYTWT
jgi:hypothetical protein